MLIKTCRNVFSYLKELKIIDASFFFFLQDRVAERHLPPFTFLSLITSGFFFLLKVSDYFVPLFRFLKVHFLPLSTVHWFFTTWNLWKNRAEKSNKGKRAEFFLFQLFVGFLFLNSSNKWLYWEFNKNSFHSFGAECEIWNVWTKT